MPKGPGASPADGGRLRAAVEETLKVEMPEASRADIDYVAGAVLDVFRGAVSDCRVARKEAPLTAQEVQAMRESSGIDHAQVDAIASMDGRERAALGRRLQRQSAAADAVAYELITAMSGARPPLVELLRTSHSDGLAWVTLYALVTEPQEMTDGASPIDWLDAGGSIDRVRAVIDEYWRRF